MTRYLPGIDAGSGAVRALLVDGESGRMTVAARAWEHPRAAEGGWSYDFDSERNWALLAEVVRQALHRSGAAPTDVAGITVTSMRHTLVLIRDGRVIFAVPNRDARAAPEAMTLATERADDSGGHPADAGGGAAAVYPESRDTGGFLVDEAPSAAGNWRGDHKSRLCAPVPGHHRFAAGVDRIHFQGGVPDGNCPCNRPAGADGGHPAPIL